MISALSAGIAGIIQTGWLGAVTTNIGAGMELQVIAAAVIGGANLAGGVGTAFGALVGARSDRGDPQQPRPARHQRLLARLPSSAAPSCLPFCSTGSAISGRANRRLSARTGRSGANPIAKFKCLAPMTGGRKPAPRREKKTRAVGAGSREKGPMAISPFGFCMSDVSRNVKSRTPNRAVMVTNVYVFETILTALSVRRPTRRGTAVQIRRSQLASNDPVEDSTIDLVTSGPLPHELSRVTPRLGFTNLAVANETPKCRAHNVEIKAESECSLSSTRMMLPKSSVAGINWSLPSATRKSCIARCSQPVLA